MGGGRTERKLGCPQVSVWRDSSVCRLQCSLFPLLGALPRAWAPGRQWASWRGNTPSPSDPLLQPRLAGEGRGNEALSTDGLPDLGSCVTLGIHVLLWTRVGNTTRPSCPPRGRQV